MAEFEQALAAYRQLVVDMDGDGIPDAPLQQPIQPETFRQRLERDPRGQINPPELRSYTPTPGDHVRQATGSPMAGQVTNAMLQYGPVPAQEFVNQPIRTGNALNEAIQDPTLANVTNAGVQTAFTALRPTAAMGVLGAGYGVAAARDLGLDPFTSANAQEPPQTEAAPQAPDEMTQILTRQQGLIQQRDAARAEMQAQTPKKRKPTPQDDPLYTAAKEKVDSLDAQILALDERVNQIRQANSPEAQLEAQRAQEANAEYQRAIQRAETMRDDELAKNVPFAELEIGKLYNETGGFAPMAAGVLGGMAGRMGHGGSTNAMVRYGAPVAEGAFLGGSTAIAPIMYDMNSTPSENPERRAYMAYARELPPEHPRKQEFMEYARSLPEQNPTQRMAQERFDNDFWGIVGKGTYEGATGGLLGSTLIQAGGRGINAMLGRGGPSTPPTPTQVPSTSSSNRMLQGMGQASQYQPPAPTPPPAPQHPSNFQPRNNGKFAGPPQYPKGHPRNP